jgi:hypothetical protein
MKVVELTQTRVTPFQEGLEIRANGLTPNLCNSFYTNLQSLYGQQIVLIIYGIIMK